MSFVEDHSEKYNKVGYSSVFNVSLERALLLLALCRWNDPRLMELLWNLVSEATTHLLLLYCAPWQIRRTNGLGYVFVFTVKGNIVYYNDNDHHFVFCFWRKKWNVYIFFQMIALQLVLRTDLSVMFPTSYVLVWTNPLVVMVKTLRRSYRSITGQMFGLFLVKTTPTLGDRHTGRITNPNALILSP